MNIKPNVEDTVIVGRGMLYLLLKHLIFLEWKKKLKNFIKHFVKIHKVKLVCGNNAFLQMEDLHHVGGIK